MGNTRSKILRMDTTPLTEWQQKYPLTLGKPTERTCYSLFGLEINPGWYPLVEDLIAKIEGHLAEKQALGLLDPDYPFSVFQIKEKYGTLRFYVSAADDTIFQWIHEAERKSASVCEMCGADGKLCGSSWLHTLCESCRTANGIDPLNTQLWGDDNGT